MARRISLSGAHEEEVRADFEKAIAQFRADFEKMVSERRISDINLSYSKFRLTDEKAVLVFSERAWLQMFHLIDSTDNEIAWHGNFIKEIPGRYYCSNIVVYPQTVTGATVEMDEAEYAKWLIEHDGDNDYRNLYLQGHSHVNMGVLPSATDLRHQYEIMQMLPDDGFYAFVIVNKARQIYAVIYDLQDNIMYEPEDIEIRTFRNMGVLDVVDSAKVLVKEPAPVKRDDETDERIAEYIRLNNSKRRKGGRK